MARPVSSVASNKYLSRVEGVCVCVCGNVDVTWCDTICCIDSEGN